MGVLVGSGYGATALQQTATRILQDQGPRRVGSFLATASMDSAAVEIATRVGATGPCAATVAACATGTTCIGDAFRMIQRGDADVVFAGGADDAVTPLDMAAAAKAGALSRRNDEPHRASRPLDRDRDGFVMGAGAGVVVLEEAGYASHRGAPVLAEIVGYGTATDVHHPTAPHPEGLGAKRAIRSALDDAALDPSQVDHVNVHATGTPVGDGVEVAALREVFGAHTGALTISATKALTGHLTGPPGRSS